MFKKFLTGLTAAALAASFVSSARAQTVGVAYITSITYQNLSSGTANIEFKFYAEGAAATTYTHNATLVANAAGALYVGGISQISAGFKGSTVMSSDQAVAATLVQIPQNSPSKGRPLSNGFSGGTPTVLIGTAVKNLFGPKFNHIIAVQNTDSVANDITIAYYAQGQATPVDTDTVAGLPAGASKYFETVSDTELADAFNGSAVVTAVKSGGTTPGSIVASVLELTAATGQTASNAFEGVASGGKTVYMPSALCNFGGPKYASFYAVQNTSNSQTATVQVTYSPGGYTQNAQVGPFGKYSFQTCQAQNITSTTPSYNGAATITSDQDVIVIGKVNGGGLTTAFLGAADGANKVALPYVRWASDANYNENSSKQRTFITVQNVGTTVIPTGTVTVTYYDPTGGISGTHTISVQLLPGAKVASNANFNNSATFEFGYITGNTGGSALIVGPADSKLSAVARVQNPIPGGLNAGEDFNGIPVR